MDPVLTFRLLSPPVGLIVFGLLGFWYTRPALMHARYGDALAALLLFSTLRYLGALFIVPGLSNGLAATPFALPAAIGDCATAAIAVAGAIAARNGMRIAVLLAWLYGIAGSLDFMQAAYLAQRSDLPAKIGSLWPIVILGGPAFMIALVLLFMVLISHPEKRAIAPRVV